MASAKIGPGLQLRSTVKKEGVLEISLVSVPTPEPKADEVVVRVEASPINPSDLGLLFGGADMTAAKVSGPRNASGDNNPIGWPDRWYSDPANITTRTTCEASFPSGCICSWRKLKDRIQLSLGHSMLLYIGSKPIEGDSTHEAPKCSCGHSVNFPGSRMHRSLGK